MSEPRRIVLLTTDFLPMSGGIAGHLDRLARHLARDMHVTVMTTVDQAGARREHDYELIELPPLPERKLGVRRGDSVGPVRKLHTAAYFLALRRHADAVISRVARLATADPTAVVIGLWDTASHFWCEACRRADLPYSLMAYGVEIVAPLYGRLPAWRSSDFAGAARVVAISRATSVLAAERFRLATQPPVVHPGVGPRPDASAVRSRAEELGRELGLGRGPVVLSVGRLVARKGFDLVLRAVADLRDLYPSLTYIVAGDGPERDRLDTTARALGVAERIRMLGAVDELTKWAAYGLCDLFVMPNRLLGGRDWEGFGIVFLEAALTGRPVIAGRTGGAPEAVVEGVTGLLVDPEQPGELTGAIRRLLDDAVLRGRMGRAGAARVRAEFSGEAVAAHFTAALGWRTAPAALGAGR